MSKTNIFAAALAFATVWAGGLTSARAASSGSGSVANIVCVNGNNACAFTLTGSRTSSQPSCAGSDPSYAFVVNTTAGQSTLKLLLAAKAAGWKINAYGRSTCSSTYGNGYQEDLDYVQLLNN